MNNKKRRPIMHTFSSPFLLCLVLTILCSFLTVKSDGINPVGDVLDKAKNATQTAFDQAKNATQNIVDGTTGALNDTKNAADDVVKGTTAALNNTKSAAQHVVNGTKDASHVANGAPNSFPGKGALVLVYVVLGWSALLVLF